MINIVDEMLTQACNSNYDIIVHTSGLSVTGYSVDGKEYDRKEIKRAVSLLHYLRSK